eukprot:gb/GECH01012204.1/.p1 GENE.gb/GECH01012204.1/~~gb/GECH01012204.1/.p1  ORF type:complete len:249 (+),score=63.35 gb/GECH01012204.1/:1-747(+)
MHRVSSRVGTMIREAGQALDRAGSRIQGNFSFKENLNRNRRVMNFESSTPTISKNVFIAPNATIIGNVSLGNNSSVWYNAVVRGDVNNISIGESTNIQDRVVIHVASFNENLPTKIGNNVTIENGAIIHACTLEDETFVGIGSTILDNAKIGHQSMISPGSLVTPNTQVGEGELWAGSPAKLVRKLSEEEKKSIGEMSKQMAELADKHRIENDKEFEELEREIKYTEYRDMRLGDYHPLKPKQREHGH